MRPGAEKREAEGRRNAAPKRPPRNCSVRGGICFLPSYTLLLNKHTTINQILQNRLPTERFRYRPTAGKNPGCGYLRKNDYF